MPSKQLREIVFAMLALWLPSCLGAGAAEAPSKSATPARSAVGPSILEAVGGFSGVIGAPAAGKPGSADERARLKPFLDEVERFGREAGKLLDHLSQMPELTESLQVILRVVPRAVRLQDAFLDRMLTLWLGLVDRGEIDAEPDVRHYFETLRDLMRGGKNMAEIREILKSDQRTARVQDRLNESDQGVRSLLTRTEEEERTIRAALESDSQMRELESDSRAMLRVISDPAEHLGSALTELIDSQEFKGKLELASPDEIMSAAKILVNRKVQAERARKLRAAYAGSFTGRLCAKPLGTMSQQVSNPKTLEALRAAHRDLSNTVRQNRALLVTLLAKGAPIPGSESQLKARFASLSSEFVLLEDVKAIAWAAPSKSAILPSRVAVSTGLVAKICALADPRQEVEALALQLERNAKLRTEVTFRDYVREMQAGLPGASIGGIEPWMLALEIRRREVIAALMLTFVLGHEFAHLSLDALRDPEPLEPAGRELRADVLGLLMADVSNKLSARKRECDVAIRTSRRCHVSDDAISEVASDYSFDQFLGLYQRTEFSEGDAEHPPIQERLSRLGELYFEIYVKGRRKASVR